MIKSIAWGLLTGSLAVVVLSMTQTARVKPILATTSASVRLHAPIHPTTSPLTELRIYRIDDLIAQIAKNEISIGRQLPSTQPDERIWPISQTEIVDSIIKLIEDQVDSDAWLDNGGTIGSIREIGGMLIVRNTPDALDKIEAILHEMRQKAK
jgi:hypothetical protein